MRAKLATLWENVRAGLWFVPALLVAAALVLSSVLIEVDVVLARREEPILPWLFSGTADAARSILSAIAGSLITVVSIAFSITMVAIVQASAQFTPRVLRQFTASRINQIVLGSYISTFIYALLVLRSVRSAQESGSTSFVPALSVTVALVLALICLGLLIYFIHAVAQSLQVAVVLDRVRRELVAQIEALYPEQELDDERVSDRAELLIEQHALGESRFTIRAQQTGFLRAIDHAALRSISFGAARRVWVRPQVGAFIAHGSVLAELDRVDDSATDLGDRVRAAFVIDQVRSITQDPLFGIRQLVDIALKALSPGINDMTTAEYALAHLGDALGRLSTRAWPAHVERSTDQQTLVIFHEPAWPDFVDTAFSQIRRAAEQDVHVTQALLHVLHELAQQVPPGERRDPLARQVAEIRHTSAHQPWSPADRAQIERAVDQVSAALHEGTPTA